MRQLASGNVGSQKFPGSAGGHDPKPGEEQQSRRHLRPKFPMRGRFTGLHVVATVHERFGSRSRYCFRSWNHRGQPPQNHLRYRGSFEKERAFHRRRMVCPRGQDNVTLSPPSGRVWTLKEVRQATVSSLQTRRAVHAPPVTRADRIGPTRPTSEHNEEQCSNDP
jgi:hypothetical protein